MIYYGPSVVAILRLLKDEVLKGYLCNGGNVEEIFFLCMESGESVLWH